MKTILLLPIFFTLLLISCFAQDIQPKVIRHEAPTYPPAARAIRAQGDIVVTIKIDNNGNVNSVKVENGHPLLRKVCEIASGNWKFSHVSETKERETKVIYSFRIKPNNSSKNNYKDDKIKDKFRKPNRVEITAIVYPRIDYSY